MARRMKKAESTAIGYLIVIGAIGVGAVKFFESVGFIVPAVIVIAVIGLYLWHKSNKKKQRLTYLREKYKNEEVVQDIMASRIWQGQTANQLTDTLGEPEDIDNKVLKTMKREVWKYEHRGGNRYGLRITVEDDEVVGWDQKT